MLEPSTNKVTFGKTVLSGFIWSGIERLSVQLVAFVLGIILARLLTPNEYGTIGLLIVFISFSQIFIDSGFSKALIQKQNPTALDISSVFVFNLLISSVCYLVLFFTAPLVADFYNIPNLTLLFRVLAVSLFFYALMAIPQTLFSLQMDFKTIAKLNILATALSGILAIYLAYQNYGEWALVWQTLCKTGLLAILFLIASNWTPQLKFSKQAFKSLFGFGSRLLVSSLLGSLVSNLAAVFIGKVINPAALGIYTRGTQFADMAYGTINTVYDSVLLPSLAKYKENLTFLVTQTSKIIKASSVLVFPFFCALAVGAKPLILILLTEKWAAAAPIMSIICVSRSITIMSGISINLLYTVGRSDLVLKQQYGKLAIRLILLVTALPFGIFYIAIADLVATIIHFFINTHYPGKIMKYGAFKQLKDMRATLVLTIATSLLVYLLMLFTNNSFLKLLILGISFPVFMISASYFLKLEGFTFIIANAKSFYEKK
ncbi:Polysaccharide biosynthesis protein [Croceitalea dokdonensis DOKDO 023]|uniref:Polysaccharide biosynthesis protein n=1 Tax=Croceitalea dokdonensis DOKDO 023 TaxID=1300341 RepID=A0A0P7A1S0_9FLAO|nr:lipopolysaccharide biosynthesis protein [Croceitalea dokdonensis]KPM30354.1 Polysaccharide biosynthesis protein [Croceitalea dokdonensis DOKDO 023]